MNESEATAVFRRLRDTQEAQALAKQLEGGDLLI